MVQHRPPGPARQDARRGPAPGSARRVDVDGQGARRPAADAADAVTASGPVPEPLAGPERPRPSVAEVSSSSPSSRTNTVGPGCAWRPVSAPGSQWSRFATTRALRGSSSVTTSSTRSAHMRGLAWPPAWPTRTPATNARTRTRKHRSPHPPSSTRSTAPPGGAPVIVRRRPAGGARSPRRAGPTRPGWRRCARRPRAAVRRAPGVPLGAPGPPGVAPAPGRGGTLASVPFRRACGSTSISGTERTRVHGTSASAKRVSHSAAVRAKRSVMTAISSALCV